MGEIIYCLTNPAMANMVKLGKTNTSVEQRMKELDKTGVPLPFDCVKAIEVENATEAEKRLHTAFEKHRVRPSREFFRVSEKSAIAAMELTGGVDVTPRSDVVGDVEDLESIQKARKKKEAFNFNMVGIAPGSTLTFRVTEEEEEEPITATVHDHKRIEFRGRVMSLTAAAGIVMGERDKFSKVPGPQYWYFEDESLAERRNRMEQEGEDD